MSRAPSTTSRPARIRKLPNLRSRAPDAHKGSFGRVLVVGGSVGMSGAPALVALAALRSGAGLVTVAVPEPIQPTVAGLCPCATSIPLPATSAGQIAPAASLRVFRKRGLLNRQNGHPPDVLIVGPGIGTGPTSYARQVWELIDAFRDGAGVPAIIDADALNLSSLSKKRPQAHELRPVGSPHGPHAWNLRSHPRTIITPHPGELARMRAVPTKRVQADRESFATETARMMCSGIATDSDETPVVVLKGAGTVVTDGARIYVNRTGNPGMATGGSGDVLAGILGALVGQGLDRLDAAVLGVHVHGLAGDLAADRVGQTSLIATDIIDALPAAFKRT